MQRLATGICLLAFSSLALASELSSFLVDINGESRILKTGEILSVVKGDVLTIRSALLQPENEIAELVQVRGLITNRVGPKRENRGTPIDTAADLDPRLAVNGEHSPRFEVRASSKGILHGLAYVEVKDPRLDYAVISVNDREMVVRDGVLAAITSTDKFKVERIQTNVNDLDEVKVQFAPLPSHENVPGVQFFEIRFLRADQAFARIPLQVRGS